MGGLGIPVAVSLAAQVDARFARSLNKGCPKQHEIQAPARTQALDQTHARVQWRTTQAYSGVHTREVRSTDSRTGGRCRLARTSVHTRTFVYIERTDRPTKTEERGRDVHICRPRAHHSLWLWQRVFCCAPFLPNLEPTRHRNGAWRVSEESFTF